LTRLISEIDLFSEKAIRLTETLRENIKKIEMLSELNNSYNQLIARNIAKINRKLEINNENVLNINFTYDFNIEDFKQILFEEFYNTFSNYHIPGTSSVSVKEVLFIIEPNEDLLALDFKSFYAKLESEIDLRGYKKVNNYVKIVTDICSSNINFDIYKLILKKHLYNLSRFIRIRGFYGDRELLSCSFGQRRTAVIVTLLMTGVKPLIIDEPEAHLDNKLIADYLVDLIQKKTRSSNYICNP